MSGNLIFARKWVIPEYTESYTRRNLHAQIMAKNTKKHVIMAKQT
jgi:hypothetical protein